MTPEINSDTQIKVVFNDVLTSPELKSFNIPFVGKTNDGENTASVFATASGNVNGYERALVGMLFTPDSLDIDVFTLDGGKAINIECDEPNSIGQYGVNIRGTKLTSGTYYVRAYAVYKNENGEENVVYGDIVPFTVE